jgi:2-haloacid dehalogenase
MGTLFDRSAPGERLVALGAPPLLLELWFARLLHAAATVTLIDAYRPFPDLATDTLESLLVQHGLDPARAEDVVAELGKLDPYPEAERALARIDGAGLPVVALTNGTEENTLALLGRSGLDRYVERVISTDAVGAFKPHPAIYRHAVEELDAAPAEVVLIAAHGWDVAGARANGLSAVWVSRLERRWPLPPPVPPIGADLEDAAERVLQSAG